MNRTCRVGVHGRNDTDFHEHDYTIIREAKIECVKMMSQTRVEVFNRLKQAPNMEIITRLYDDRFGKHGHPSPEDFANKMVPLMRQLQPFCVKFEVHNEPNHLDRIEGWGQDDADAKDFNEWFLRVYDILKTQCPWAQLGFPGLAIPHRDQEWVEICRRAVEKSDWLGVHCYWQTPQDQLHNHLADFWGLRFKYYNQKFPNKIIDLTEVGNSNVQNKIPFTRETHAREFTEYLTECFKYPYLNSASFFIMSSPDRTWDGFCWRNESGEIYPITRAVGSMHRPFWEQAGVAAPAQPKAAAQPAQQAAAQVAATPVVQAAALPEQSQARIDQLQGQVQQLQNQSNQLQSLVQQLQIQMQQLAAAINAGAVPTAGQATQPVAQPVAAPPALPAPAIQNIIQQLASNPAMPLPARTVNQIDRIIVHHTAVSPGVGAQQIAAFLVNQRNRPGISYHYFITADGPIQQTNEVTTVTLQSTDELNAVSIGVGFAGDFTSAVPSQAQIESGAQLIAWLIRQLNLSPQAVFGHKELINTKSPGDQWDGGAMWGSQLRQRIQAYLGGA